MAKLLNVEALIMQYHGNTDFAKEYYKLGKHLGLDINPINRLRIPEDSQDWNIYNPLEYAEVKEVSNDVNYGINVIIYCKELRSSLHFAHLKRTSLRVGKILSPDEFVGVIGNTGNSTGRHLHIGYIPMYPWGRRLFNDEANPYFGIIDPLGFLIARGVNI